MNSYGNMHYKRLIGAFMSLRNEFFKRNTNIIDWGCGQALASMAYFDFLNKKRITQQSSYITLIEPSEIALKRASLHVKKFNSTVEINTVKKDLDTLIDNDFTNKTTSTHLHLFSNILDIELFSLSALLKLVESNFPGDNYFICVSPYVNDTRTSRLDAFVKYFTKKPSFKELESIDNRNGEWQGNWTRVVRVFKVKL